MTWILLCQEVVLDGRTGENVAGSLVAVRSDCEVIEYDSLEQAAESLAISPLELRLDVPDEPGWERWRSMPPLMRKKFERLLAEQRKLQSKKRVPVGMVLAKSAWGRAALPSWTILFVAYLPGGKHAAPDLETLADMLGSDDEIVVTRMSEMREEGEYDLPDGWRELLGRLIDARRMAATVIERARK